MSNVKFIGNERIEVVNNEQDLTLRFYHTDGRLAAYVMQIPKEDLSKIINLLLEAQRVFNLAPRIVTKPWTQPIAGSITPTDDPNPYIGMFPPTVKW